MEERYTWRMKIYVSGVGVGMGPLAFIARDVGNQVVCSDLIEHELVDYMREEGFTVHIGQSGESIRAEHEASPIDWFVHTSALPADHPELRYAHEVGMKVSKRDAFINDILIDHELDMIAVAGTHGKTNTTGMVVWSLMQAGIPYLGGPGAEVPTWGAIVCRVSRMSFCFNDVGARAGNLHSLLNNGPTVVKNTNKSVTFK